jgi:hypothetical protein
VLFSCKGQQSNTDNTASKDSTDIRKQVLKVEETPKTTQEVQDKSNTKYNSYTNARYGYSVMYPTNFEKKAESENADGREFNSSEGFNMIVYGSNDASVLGKSIDETYKEELSLHKDVTYKLKKKNWFVVSGYDGEYIFYVKKYVGKGSTNTLSLKYPSNLRDKYYDIVTVISKSFKEGDLDSAN